MVWKIYFWALLILSTIGLLGVLGHSLEKFNLLTFISLLYDFLIVLSLYAYSYKKQFFNPAIWKVVFLLSLADLVFNIATFFMLHIKHSLLTWIITLPIYYPVFKLAFPPKKSK